MALFHYQPNRELEFIGTTKYEIIQTVRYLKREDNLDITDPKPEDIDWLESICLGFEMSGANPGQTVETRIMDGALKLTININAMFYIYKKTSRISLCKRGELYLLFGGLGAKRTYFLPEQAMIELREYRWDRHINELLAYELTRLEEPKPIEDLFREAS